MNKKRWSNKRLALLISIILVVTCTVGVTLAYIVTSTGSVVNTFKPATIGTDIVEKIEGEVKKSVAVENNSDMPVYVRAQIVVTWKNPDTGEVLGETPVKGADKDYDYNLLAGESYNWIVGADGYYYYKVPVDATEPENVTDPLITNGVAKHTNGDYVISMEILTQSVQAEPATAVTELWGVTVAEDGTISK